MFLWYGRSPCFVYLIIVMPTSSASIIEGQSAQMWHSQEGPVFWNDATRAICEQMKSKRGEEKKSR